MQGGHCSIPSPPLLYHDHDNDDDDVFRRRTGVGVSELPLCLRDRPFERSRLRPFERSRLDVLMEQYHKLCV